MIREKINFIFHDKFIFRSPANFIGKTPNSVSQLKEIAQRNYFQEALYIASPSFYKEVIHWLKEGLREKKKELRLHYSLFKYISRMNNRCTPYGLFASCGTGTWSDINEIALLKKRERHTRLDMNFVCEITERLALHPTIQQHLLFFPNSSSYKCGNQIRYIEYKYINNKRNHSISSVDANEYQRQILSFSKNGATIPAIIKSLEEKRVGKNEAVLFIKEIIECRLLVSEMEPAITGEDFLEQLVFFLTKLNEKINSFEINKIVSLFSQVENKLREIDSQIGNDIEIYSELITLLKTIELPLEENYLFQVDSFYY